MSLIVMKFGGSSVGTTERMQRVAQRIVDNSDAGHKVVVVVSAMGDTTDELIDQSRRLNPNPQAREMDMLLTTGEQISVALLSMTIQGLGRQAVSMTGGRRESAQKRCTARRGLRTFSRTGFMRL